MDESKCAESARPELNRRAFLSGAALTALPLATVLTTEAIGAQEPVRQPQPGRDRSFPGMITRQKNPDNLEFPFPTLDSFVTPTEQFYIRSHFEVPELEARTWRLQIEGAVEKPFEIGFAELQKMTSRTMTALLECSGNSRVLLTPPQVGLRWEQGGVSNAEWTGVPLSALLQRAQVRAGAVEVILEGSDQGEFKEPEPKTPGVIHYARSLPLNKARQPEVLLAYRMNGRELAPAHGYPVRVVVPGWYGMASVKWLKRIVVTDRPFQGFFQTFMYTIWQRRGGLPDLVPVTEVQVKAQIARPVLHEVIAPRTRYRVFGAAWTGEADVTKVEVSTDKGQRWSEARLLDKAIRHAWRFWEYDWLTPKQTGHYTLMARATDSQKRLQPMQRDQDRRDAVINHVQQIQVEIR